MFFVPSKFGRGRDEKMSIRETIEAEVRTYGELINITARKEIASEEQKE